MNIALLIAVLDMCWSFFVTKKAYIMSIILIKSIRKFGAIQEAFALESDFMLGSFPHPNAHTATQTVVSA